MWSKSHWPPAARGHRVGGMNPSGEPAEDRRAVPRHIRDGEHDSWEDTMAGVPAGRPGKPRLMISICVALALAAAISAWFALR